ncbi:MAG: hypothetical protein EHM35_04100 [Planctomycetaceae bacterium]|nr:MAG: hypothetical protein EHM35_04100 [Planctomycetaceae bacterium]
MRRLSKVCDSWKQPIARLPLAIAAVAILLASCASFKHLTLVSNTFPSAKDCGKCHVEIYHEWSESDHAHACTNPHFRAATDDYRFQSCLSCHAPEPALTTYTPALRAAGREEGVTCVACHLDQGALAGPLEPTGKVHPHPISVRPEVYHSSGICGRCHEGTMTQWESVDAEKRTCQQCHMESVTRKVTQATGGISNVLVAMEKQLPQRRHEFCILGEAQSQELVTLTIKPSGDSLDVVVENNLPHSLPTGDFGFRIVTLEVFGIDAGGKSILAGSWELAGESSTAIPAQGARAWSLDIGPGCKTARAVLTRRSYDQEALVLAEAQVEVARP